MSDRLIKDLLLAEKCMVETSTFPTGQGIMRDAANLITSLTAERDAAIERANMHGGRYWEGRYRDEAAENERFRNRLDQIHKKVIQCAGDSENMAFCIVEVQALSSACLGKDGADAD